MVNSLEMGLSWHFWRSEADALIGLRKCLELSAFVWLLILG